MDVLALFWLAVAYVLLLFADILIFDLWWRCKVKEQEHGETTDV